ncbi:hypothetical protein PF050_01275 [Kosakonia pseudosacchari]|nr:hypothetical protein [Kosakonia pseudosacchari]WBU49592.1 hypothetical protein PF050_01275 [Kosakonia pseudosacchari]
MSDWRFPPFGKADWDVPQNLRFQGPYFDRETVLHYNTVRYYVLYC